MTSLSKSLSTEEYCLNHMKAKLNGCINACDKKEDPEEDPETSCHFACIDEYLPMSKFQTCVENVNEKKVKNNCWNDFCKNSGDLYTGKLYN